MANTRFTVGERVRITEGPFFMATGVVVKARVPLSKQPVCLVKMDLGHQELRFRESVLTIVR